ncbi:hypothetical protein ACM41_20610 [Bradyrhizobium sp. CCBAU 21362]|uniref:acyltransferase family protein n=1 Tax=Bradyrhizobium sp. CCBAU 21362 TaxID=1325082 RepID=UPI0023057329|nr:acyltransferase family protein [Bradyrhizobium sp. CCBAU 21362]MDA9538521.1 hypothetical protein [Bradyrhizobium sp. CCBAU 21362]
MNNEFKLTSPSEQYRPDIDGLRAFAVLAVVLYHAFPKEVRGGFVGVDVFFVISGFLISSILLREMTESRFSFGNFYARRVRRIFPALCVCLGAVLAYGFVCLLPFELMQLGKHVFFGAAFLSNLAVWSETGYFGIAATLKPLLHLWSLGIEEQFYIVWPALLWIAFRKKARLDRLLVVLILVSFSINVALSFANISDDFFLPFSRFWELLAGAELARRGHIGLAPKVQTCLSIGGLSALVGSVALFAPELRFPGWLALLPVAGAMALIAAGPTAIVNRTILSHPVAVFVGLISYPLYLWHWPLISYAYIIRLGKPPTPLMAATLVAISFLMAWATFRFIECPIRLGAHRWRRTQIVAACIVMLGLSGLTVWMNNGFPERFPQLPGLDIRKISEARLDSSFQPTQGMDVLSYNQTIVAHLGKGDRKVAFGGDSLLFQYGPRVQQLIDTGQLAANTYFVTGGSCAPVPGVIQQDDFAHCANLPGILIDQVRREKIQSVVLGASWAGYGGANMRIERGGERLSLDGEDGKDAFYANLEDYVQQLQSLNAEVYLVLGAPVHHTRFNPTEMIKRNITSFKIASDVGEGVPIAELRAAYGFADYKLRRVSAVTGAILLDPLPDVCGAGSDCSAFFEDAKPKYSDGVHLRPAFVREHLHFLDFLLK